MNELCPCGSGQPEASCCAPIIAGAPAPTALALMRSRYTAYVRGAVDHVVATHDPVNREDVDRDAAEKWSKETVWQGLEIVSTSAGGADDDTGEVEFVARGVTNGTPFAHRERSRFRKVEGRWFYSEAKKASPAKAVVTAGRNDPCPCGSGKKFKRCHGA